MWRHLILLFFTCPFVVAAVVASSILPQRSSPVQLSPPPSTVRGNRKETPIAAGTSSSASPFLAQPNDDTVLTQGRRQEEEEKESHIAAIIASKLMSIITAVYGVALLLHGLPTFRGQIHVLTMMRASGYRKIERCIEKVRRNFRDAYWKAIRNSPSLYYANRSLTRIDGRIASARAIMAETRKAKEDGKITPREQRRLDRMRRRYIRRLRGDAIRLRKAKSSLGHVISALDIEGTWDIFKEMIVTMSTIMATGHHDARLAKFVCRYCHFLNLGSLVCEANRRIGFPISRFLWTGEFIDSDLDDEDHKGIAITGVFVSYAVSAYLMFRHNVFALRLSAALLASVMILRGVSSLFIGKDGSLEELEFFRHKPDQRLMGVMMIGLAIFGMRYSHLGYDENADLDVHKIFWPLFGVERAIGSSLTALKTLAK